MRIKMAITQEQAREAYRLLRELLELNSTERLRQLQSLLISVEVRDLLKEINDNKQTNGDRWRAMSDKQIAEIIMTDGCCSCPVDDNICQKETEGVCDEEEFNKQCKKAIMEWLKQEAE